MIYCGGHLSLNIGGQQGSPDHEAPRRPIFCTEASAVTSMGPSGHEVWGPSVGSAKPQNGKPAGLGNSLKCFKYSEKLFGPPISPSPNRVSEGVGSPE